MNNEFLITHYYKEMKNPLFIYMYQNLSLCLEFLPMVKRNQNMCMGQSSFYIFNSVQNYIEQTIYF